MSNEIINPYQQFLDDSGNPLASGTIDFYTNTTTTLSTIYSNEALTTAQSNPYTLDANGCIAGDVRYRGLKTLLIKDSLGAHVRTLDNVGSADVSADTWVIPFATMATAIASTDARKIYDGAVLLVKDRANSTWDVVLSSGVTENTYDVVQCTGVATLSLVLRLENGNTINVKALGAKDDGVTNNYLIFKACSALLDDYRCVNFDGDGTFLVTVAAGSVPSVSGDDIGIFKLREHRGVTLKSNAKTKIRIEVDFTSGGSLAFLHAQGAREFTAQGLNIDYQASGAINTGSDCRATLFHLFSSDTNPSASNTIRDCTLRINHADGPNFGYSEGADAGKVIGIYCYGDKPGGIVDDFKFINNTFWDTTARVVWLWRTRNSVCQGNMFLQSGEYPCFRCLAGNENLSIIGNTFDMIQDGTFHSACIAIYAQGTDSYGHVIADNIFYVANGKAMELSEATHMNIHHNIIYWPSTALGDQREGITLTTLNAEDNHVTIDNNWSNRSFVILGTGNEINVTNNTLAGKSIGYSGNATAGNRLGHNINGNRVLGAGSITYNANSGQCNGNTIKAAEYHGIDMRATVATGLQHVQIHDNFIDEFNTLLTAGTAPNTYHGIYIAAGNCDVQSNMINADSVVANSYGIYAPSTSGDKTVITDNNMRGAATGNYGANTIVFNNIVGNALVP